MQTVELAEAQSRLPELIASLAPGEEIVIARQKKPVARLVPPATVRTPRPLREFAGKFHPLPQSEQDDLKGHDRFWCEPNAWRALGLEKHYQSSITFPHSTRDKNGG